MPWNRKISLGMKPICLKKTSSCLVPSLPTYQKKLFVFFKDILDLYTSVFFQNKMNRTSIFVGRVVPRIMSEGKS
jgi:hypothetical protein